MEEKEQGRKFFYTAKGKAFRGLLCILTFCAFMVGLIFSAYGVKVYGTSIITHPAHDYRDTPQYMEDVIYEMYELSNMIQNAHRTNQAKGLLGIIDATQNNLCYLDLDLIAMAQANGKYPANWEQCLKEYEVNTQTLTNLHIDDYQAVREYIEDEGLGGDYLYLDTVSFRNLFVKNGYRNTGHRFSDNYSERAYFVFDFQNSSSNLKNGLADDPDGNIYKQIIDEVSFLIIDGVKVELEEAAISSITHYDLSEEQYAVYDPDADIFYSVWDESFTPMDSYIYRLDEIRDNMENGNSSRYDSIILPLLHSYNYSFYELAKQSLNEYHSVTYARAFLENCANDGIFYSLTTREGESYSNMEHSSSILNLDYSYQVMKNSDTIYRILNGDGTVAEEITNILEESDKQLAMADYPSNTTLCFAFYPSDDLSLEYSSRARHIRDYPLFSHYIRMFLAIAVVALILIFVQAVWLIQTTGRTKKDDTGVKLNWFDCRPIEIWLIICCIILLGTILYAKANINLLSYNRGIFEGCVKLTAASLPFVFCFMVLTLSFARRIKAKNLWKCSLIAKVFHQIGSGKKAGLEEEAKTEEKQSLIARLWTAVVEEIVACKTFFRQLSETTRLMIQFIMYIVLNTILAIGLHRVTESQATDYSGIVIGFIIIALYVILQVLAIRKVLAFIKDINLLIQGIREITEGNLDYKIAVDESTSLYQELVDGINHISDGLKAVVEVSLKDERMKTELITNVSHDLKTPLTSIINYINLLKTEKMPTPEAEHYIEVLDSKAQRLRHLTEDLVEAAKATSGNIELEKMPLAFDELMKQALGEFEDKFATRNLTVIANYTEEPAMVMADGRRVFRIIENVLQNVCKYALEGTRIYADLSNSAGMITFTLKNISAAPLNISPEELMKRFTRGDSSRTTEGSGLGLSIAKELTRLHDGSFEIVLDGDLFKVIIRFPELTRQS